MFLVESVNQIYVLSLMFLVLCSVDQEDTIGFADMGTRVLLALLTKQCLYLSQEDVSMEGDSGTVEFASILQF
jgi:hypothetical protein